MHGLEQLGVRKQVGAEGAGGAPAPPRHTVDRMANRLARSTSPYLLQHQDNPVDWQEWSPEAFAEAKRRDVPVLLSVGYAACHWCHVMAHESFEDEGVAEALNRDFVSVKVDREERPDIDAVYMAATTALTGQGGWPMTCFLTPDGEPFYCGTYFPRDHFLQLLQAVHDTWTDQRERVLETGGTIVARLQEIGGALPAHPIGEDVLDGAVARLFGQFDEARGGFGGAPKFPPSMVLEFLLRHHGRTGSHDALYLAERTCEAMARGGMYDQLGGGFARYSVDADWVVPHFEKMLYDNAQLLRVYAHLHRSTGSALARRVALETAAFMLRDLGTAEGAFASALDADTEGVEGLTYAWTPEQLSEVLGPQDGPRAAALLEVTEHGTFEHGTSTLQLRHDPDDPAWWEGVRQRLFDCPPAAPAACPRRQGRDVVERPGDCRARRRRRAAGGALAGGGRRGLRRRPAADPPCRRTAAEGLAPGCRGRRGRCPRRLRQPRRGAGRPAPGHR